MKNLDADFYTIRDKEQQLQSMVEFSDKQDLAQCVRMISMYISMYKQHFGELPQDSYRELFSNGDITTTSAGIFNGGLNEAISMLDTVIRSNMQKEDLQNGKLTIN